ncbi:M48 family metallopeptidase [Clostridium omnivorum]|uniref:Metal-dependent hydrolase n=1 Tax=Clostridium omnivorum TaxID=1604902 RepID=A0ABQ5N7F2_9CLOT|nr:SprT family zinc-dependent metalloprotease [Clostridium sp. E14]GLC31168.1 metal-dependent hydrolase [Clostridium sp. E14]
MESLTINNIEIEVQKKNIKNLHLSVLPPSGRVRVSAPQNMNDEAIRVFLITKIGWIKQQQEKFNNQPRQTEREYVSGESVYLWGRRYRLEVVYSNIRNDIKIHGDRLVLQVREESSTEQRANVLNAWYRDNLKKEIPKLLEKWQKIIGVSVNEWGVKKMKTKWGTCNAEAKRIWLNLQLVKKSPQCLEYVIVHELVHLLEKKHNKIFTGYMNKFLPDWRTTKAELNAQILDYMEE